MRTTMAIGIGAILLSAMFTLADDRAQPASQPAATTAPATPTAEPRPLNPQGTVLIDVARRRLILKTEVVLRAGLLEMLICKSGTKEHESILAVNSDAYVIHGGLLALGAKVGTPVQYVPEFRAPTGQRIDIVLHWKDAKGEARSAPAQSWVRHAVHRYYSWPLPKLPAKFEFPSETELRFDETNGELIWFGPMTAEQKQNLLHLSTDERYRQGIEHFYESSQSKPLEAHWVFAGSGFYEQPGGKPYYQAEDGNVVCVANFGDAMLDLSIASSASNDGLQFEPWTERIPPLSTPVDVELIVVDQPEKPRS